MTLGEQTDNPQQSTVGEQVPEAGHVVCMAQFGTFG